MILFNIEAKLSFTFYYFNVMKEPLSVCFEVVKHILGETPKVIRVKLNDTNPKKKGWLKVEQDSTSYVKIKNYSYTLKCSQVDLLKSLNLINKPFWIQITEISEK